MEHAASPAPPPTMRTANPILRADTFDLRATTAAPTMTILGTVHKTALLVLIVLGSAFWVWREFPVVGGRAPADLYPWLVGGAIGGFVLALVTAFQRGWA